jgi:DNA uptake protein ComE-like DNA-binding protein
VNAKSLLLPTFLVALIPVGHYFARPALAPQLPPSTTPLRQKMSLNQAGVADLVALPGVGAKFATKFMAERPAGGFQSWDQVDAVAGRGPARLRQFQDSFEIK